MMSINTDTAAKKSGIKFIIIAAAIVILAVAIDQFTKAIFQKALNFDPQTDYSKTMPFLGDWVVFRFTLNYGASYGFFQGRSVLFFVLTLVGIPLFCLIAWFSRKESMLGAYGIAVVIGGVLGNAADRAFLGDGFFNGGVRDFIAVEGLIIPSYICNFADICINVGIAIYIIGILFVGKNAFFKKRAGKKEAMENAGQNES